MRVQLQRYSLNRLRCHERGYRSTQEMKSTQACGSNIFTLAMSLPSDTEIGLSDKPKQICSFLVQATRGFRHSARYPTEKCRLVVEIPATIHDLIIVLAGSFGTICYTMHIGMDPCTGFKAYRPDACVL